MMYLLMNAAIAVFAAVTFGGIAVMLDRSSAAILGALWSAAPTPLGRPAMPRPPAFA